MLGKKHYQLLEKLYREGPINSYYKPEIQVSDKQAEIKMDIHPKYHHGGAAVHGSIIFKMIDDAGFFAANSVVPEVFVLTANFNIHFLRPVVKGYLIGKGKVIHQGKRQIICDTVCLDSNDKIIAQGRGVYMPSKFKLKSYFPNNKFK